jgi:hypothetical protein
MSPTPDLAGRPDWRMLLSYLPKDYATLAEEHGLLSQRFNAKIREADDLLQLFLLHIGADMPLRQTCAIVAESGGPEISANRLHLKLRRATLYFRELVTRMTTWNKDFVPERWGGYAMVAVDGSVVVIPGPTGAGGRLHLVLQLWDVRLLGAHVTTDREGETLRRFDWEPGQLVLGDRGYANPPGIAHVVSQGADVLVRLNRGTLPVYDEGSQRIDLLPWLRTLEGHRACQRYACVYHEGDEGNEAIHGRLVAFRLPEDKAAKARARVQKELGSDADDAALEMAGYVVLYTTTPSQRLTAAQCIDAYRLRWQVELQFKRWKSLCHFDRLPNYRDDTVLTWLYGKMLLGLLLDRMASVATTEPGSVPDATSNAPAPRRSGRVDEAATGTSDSFRPPRRPLARQPWKLTRILWPCLVAALIPLRLHELLPRMDAITERLDRDHPSCSPQQISRFEQRLGKTSYGEYQDCADH